MGADIDGKSSSKRYKGKKAWLIRSGMDADEASRRARGYAGGKTSAKAGAKDEPPGSAEFDELPQEVANLPEDAQKIWAQAYNDAITDNDEADAAVAAWEAVKNAGYKQDGGTWIKASEITGSFRGLIALSGDMLTPAPSGMQYAATSIVEIMRTGEWVHPQYGNINIKEKNLDGFIASFYANVRGVDLAVDQEHKPEEGAEGWFKRVWKVPRTDGDGYSLMAEIQWTWRGEQLIRDGIYRYFSPEFDFEWTDPETGNKHKNVLFGGALTNRPFIKHMEPIILSEGILNTLGYVRKKPQSEGDRGKNTQGGQQDVKLSAEHYNALGLSESATEAEVLAAIAAVSNKPTEAGAKAQDNTEVIQLSETVKTTREQLTAAQGQIQQLSETNTRLAEEAKNVKWESITQKAFAEGRMTAQLAEKFKPLFMASPEAIEPIIADLPKVIPGEKGHSGAGDKAGGGTKLSESQTEVATQLGLTEEQMLKISPVWMQAQGGKE